MSHQEQHFVGMHYCGRVYYSGEDGGYSDYLIPYYAHDEIYNNYSSQNVAKSKEAHAPAPCPGCNIELKIHIRVAYLNTVRIISGNVQGVKENLYL